MFTGKGVKWNFSLDNRLLHTAMEEDKLLFLHIGYISNIKIREESLNLFDNSEVSSLLNENFIPILVDREDNPELYLLALDILFLNQDFSYGPVNMFIMPNRRPIIAFSDCNPEKFIVIAQRILQAKNEKRQRLIEMSDELSRQISVTGSIKKVTDVSSIDKSLLSIYLDSWLTSIFETDFISRFRPFTPSPLSLLSIVEYLRIYPDKAIMERVENLLDHFQYSPLFDVIDGGFFRQAADYTCLQPLFEKSLEENSQFLALYSLAYSLFGKNSYRETSVKISEFITNELNNGHGGFYSSTTLMNSPDDSVYFQFSVNELKMLFPEEYSEIGYALGLDINTDIRKRQLPVRGPETYRIISESHLNALKIRRREHRSYFKDQRVVTSSNALAVKSFAIAAQNLTDTFMYRTAKECFEYIVYNNIHKEDSRLCRYSCDSEKYLNGYLSDYAHFIEAAVELYKIGGEKEFMFVAENYIEIVIKRFYKPENGMFNKSETDTSNILFPFKSEPNSDFVRPSANSVMAGNLLSFYKITKEKKYLSMAEQQLCNVALNLIYSGPMLSSWAHKILLYINMDIRSE